LSTELTQVRKKTKKLSLETKICVINQALSAISNTRFGIFVEFLNCLKTEQYEMPGTFIESISSITLVTRGGLTIVAMQQLPRGFVS
jgi:hypothetical protein